MNLHDLIVSPPVALLLYVGLAGALVGIGKLLAPRTKPSRTENGLYASGELAEDGKSPPGYRRFFVVALFFAVLHLGALVLGTFALGIYGAGVPAGLLPIVVVYLLGLALSLLVLMLG